MPGWCACTHCCVCVSVCVFACTHCQIGKFLNFPLVTRICRTEPECIALSVVSFRSNNGYIALHHGRRSTNLLDAFVRFEAGAALRPLSFPRLGRPRKSFFRKLPERNNLSLVLALFDRAPGDAVPPSQRGCVPQVKSLTIGNLNVQYV